MCVWIKLTPNKDNKPLRMSVKIKLTPYEENKPLRISVQIKLTPNEENKSLKEEEGEADLLKKPMALDDGKWAVFCW